MIVSLGRLEQRCTYKRYINSIIIWLWDWQGIQDVLIGSVALDDEQDLILCIGILPHVDASWVVCHCF